MPRGLCQGPVVFEVKLDRKCPFKGRILPDTVWEHHGGGPGNTALGLSLEDLGVTWNMAGSHQDHGLVQPPARVESLAQSRQRGGWTSCLLQGQRRGPAHSVSTPGGLHPSACPQPQDPGEGLLGAGVDEVGAGRSVKGLPVPAAEGREAMHCHEALIALPPVREKSQLLVALGQRLIPARASPGLPTSLGTGRGATQPRAF
jgi:hypothetical protein